MIYFNVDLHVCFNMTRCASVLPDDVSPAHLCSSPALLSMLFLPKSCSPPAASLSLPALHAACITHKYVPV